MSRLGCMDKRPEDRLDYGIDYAVWIEPGDVIISGSALIDDTTATIDAIGYDDTNVVVWIMGGVDGEKGHVSVTATTQAGRVKEVCFDLHIKDC